MFFRPTGGEGPEVRDWSLLIISGVSGAQCKYKDNHQPPSGEWHTPTRARVNDTITRSINLGTGSKHHAIAGCLHILFYFCSDCGSHLPPLLPGSLTCHCRPLRFKTIEKYLADLIVRCQYLINPIDCKLCCFCSYTVFDLSETGWWEPPAIAEQILVIITSEMRGQKRPSSFSKSLTDAELLEIIDMRSCLPGQDTLLSSDVSSHSSRPPELSCKLITLNKPTEETEVCQALLESGVNGKYIVVLSVILLVCLCPYCN